MAPVAQGDSLAAGFTLPADLGVSPRHCANWVVVCVPTGGTISSPWRSDPAVSLWVEVSQLCLVMTWPWVGLSLEASREKRCVCSFCEWAKRWLLCSSHQRIYRTEKRTCFSGCEMPTLECLFSTISGYPREVCLGFAKAELFFFIERDSFISRKSNRFVFGRWTEAIKERPRGKHPALCAVVMAYNLDMGDVSVSMWLMPCTG